MNKSDLVKEIAFRADTTQVVAEKALQAALETIADSLAKGDKVTLVGFGTFSVKERQARTGRNPKTGAEIEIPASVHPHFKAGSELRGKVSG